MSLGGGAPQQQPTAVEKEQLRIAQDSWERYKAQFQPLENAMIAKVREYNDPGYRENKVGEAVAIARRLPTQAGPGTQGSFFGGLLDTATKSGGMAASGGAGVNQEAHEKYYSGLEGMTQLGTNQRQNASQGTTRLAGIQNQMAQRNALMQAKEQQNMMSGLGAMGGLAASHIYNKGGLSGLTGGIDSSNIPWSSNFIGPPAPTAPMASNPFMPVFNW